MSDQIGSLVVRVHGGARDARNVLLDLPLFLDSLPFEAPDLRDEETGEVLPAQWARDEGRWRLLFTLDHLPAGASRSLRMVEGNVFGATALVPEVSAEQVRFRLSGTDFTTYHHGHAHARPFLYPIPGPGGVSVTRHYPMAEVEGETRDHPHHRSLWVAHGDVNGSDNWSEDPGHAWIRTESVTDVFGGRVCAGLTADHLWVTRDDAPVLRERRSLVLAPLSGGAWMLDLLSRYHAAFGDVTFGDTKEGGLLSVRVATSMDVDKGGRIENSEGGVNEDETWGKQAAWCDYSGVVGGSHVGIALMDHPGNPCYPTYWHVRNYGLMTANPFGLSYYHGSKERNGSLLLPSGKTMTCRYRAYVHAGDAAAGDVAATYCGFAQPPRTEVLAP